MRAPNSAPDGAGACRRPAGVSIAVRVSVTSTTVPWRRGGGGSVALIRRAISAPAAKPDCPAGTAFSTRPATTESGISGAVAAGGTSGTSWAVIRVPKGTGAESARLRRPDEVSTTVLSPPTSTTVPLISAVGVSSETICSAIAEPDSGFAATRALRASGRGAGGGGVSVAATVRRVPGMAPLTASSNRPDAVSTTALFSVASTTVP